MTHLGSSGVHPATDETYQLLLSKHPQDATDSAVPATAALQATKPLQVTASEVESILLKLNTHTAAGPSQLSPGHLKKCVTTGKCPLKSSNWLCQLTRLINVILSGKAPAVLAPWIAAATLIPLVKDGNGCRPVAIGNLLRRVTARLACRSIKDRLPAIFGSCQVGVGVRCATESVIHLL